MMESTIEFPENSPGPSIFETSSSPIPFLNKRRSSLDQFDKNEVPSNRNSINLTWKNLWVTVPDKAVAGRRPILRGLTGYVQPGEVLAIMGPSGCGKSTLLDALAGRLESNTRQSGDIQINGRTQALAFGTSAYVTQDDTLMTTLTIREAVYYSAQLQLPDTMSKSEKKNIAEATIKEMGLDEAIDTRIGGWGYKGISGGQKRRVSICIEILTRPKLLFLDEPTSGLDSAASYHVMMHIFKLARQDRRTIVVSIHQPSGEVFDLFHNLCLLSSGRTIYFGKTSGANEFFASNGFICPTMRNPSDHYLKTINHNFDGDIEEGYGAKRKAAEAINILVCSYESSDIYQQVQLHVAGICEEKSNGSSLATKRSRAGFLTQCRVLIQRSFLNMHRDPGYYWFRFGMYICLCLCIGTVFYDIGFAYDSIQARASVLMFISTFMTYMTVGGFPSFVEDMKIFTRERLNGHYSVTSYVIGHTLSSAPYLLMVSVIPGAMTYYLVGFQRHIENFIYFSLLLFVCMILIESLMMVVASIVTNFLTGIIVGSAIQAIMMLNDGFFRLPNDIPKPIWKYPVYQISFHKYANQGLYKNEYLGLTFPNVIIGASSIIHGDEILRNIWQMEMGHSKWIDLAILFGMAIVYRLMFIGVIKSIEKFKPVIRALLAHSGKQGSDNE